MPRLRASSEQGLTLIELIVAMSILVLLFSAVWTFILRGYEFQGVEFAQVIAQETARKGLETMIQEIRAANLADSGAYLIQSADASTFTFFSDVDADEKRERVRYFLSGTNVRRGIIEPTGFPITYPTASETFTTIATSVQSGSGGNDPLFAYYPATYTGSESAMSLPVNITDIRVVRVSIVVDADTSQRPDPFTLTSVAELRSIKDNL